MSFETSAVFAEEAVSPNEEQYLMVRYWAERHCCRKLFIKFSSSCMNLITGDFVLVSARLSMSPASSICSVASFKTYLRALYLSLAKKLLVDSLGVCFVNAFYKPPVGVLRY